MQFVFSDIARYMTLAVHYVLVVYPSLTVLDGTELCEGPPSQGSIGILEELAVWPHFVEYTLNPDIFATRSSVPVATDTDFAK